MSDCCSVNGNPFSAPPVMACPENGARSKKLELLTVRSLVRRLPLEMPSTQYYFCEAANCDVVYFPSNPKAPIFRRADLLVRVGAKESDDLIAACYCFGFTQRDVQDEVAETGKSTILERIKAEVQAGRCACEVKNPSGRCCLGDIARNIRKRSASRSSR